MSRHVISAIALAVCTTFAVHPVSAQDEPAPVAPAEQPAVTEEQPSVAEEQPAVAEEQPAPAEEQPAPAAQDDTGAPIDLIKTKLADFHALLAGIKDKATAEAAAPQITALYEELDALVEKYADDIEEKDHPDLVELDGKVCEKVEELATMDEPWFGCKELGDFFMPAGAYPTPDPADEPTELTPEQEQFFTAQAEKLISVFKDMKEILEAVTDKASADAAAPKVQDQMDKLVAIYKAVLSRPDCTDAVEAFLDAKYPEAESLYNDLESVRNALIDQDLFGSEALEKALQTGIEDDEEEDAPAPDDSEEE